MGSGGEEEREGRLLLPPRSAQASEIIFVDKENKDGGGSLGKAAPLAGVWRGEEEAR